MGVPKRKTSKMRLRTRKAAKVEISGDAGAAKADWSALDKLKIEKR